VLVGLRIQVCAGRDKQSARAQVAASLGAEDASRGPMKGSVAIFSDGINVSTFAKEKLDETVAPPAGSRM
jgi:hypothetical protein